jgi:hypothetical protein
MRPFLYVYVCLPLALLVPALVYAGQIYGSIVSAGRGVGRAPLEVNCGGNKTPGVTGPDGSYRINVAQQGQCTLTLPDQPGRPSTVIFSSPNPTSYNYELLPRQGTYELQRR